MKPKLKAIVIDQVNGRTVGRGPYRNIRNAPGSIKNYLRNMKRLFPNAVHVNFYNSLGQFEYQEKYEREQIPEPKRKPLKFTHLDSGYFITGQMRFYNDSILSQWDPL